jgi:hypothetical protein
LKTQHLINSLFRLYYRRPFRFFFVSKPEIREIHDRGVSDQVIVQGAQRSTMAELADWVLSSDKVLVF